MYQDIYNCICQNTKKIRFIIHYVKPTAQLLFKIRFPKGGPNEKWEIDIIFQMLIGKSVTHFNEINKSSFDFLNQFNY